jgi:hypothetical protein
VIFASFWAAARRFLAKSILGFLRIGRRDSFFSLCDRERGGMRPKERREAGEQDLFRARLDQIIDLDHALVRLARAIDWRSQARCPFGT